jgi:hypothetical protein
MCLLFFIRHIDRPVHQARKHTSGPENCSIAQKETQAMGRKIFIAHKTEVWLPAEVVYDAESGQEIIVPSDAQHPPVKLSELPADYCFLLQVTLLKWILRLLSLNLPLLFLLNRTTTSTTMDLTTSVR